MGNILKYHPVKLFVGFISNDIGLIDSASRQLCRKFGNIHLQSQTMDFSYTDYYEKEMGKGLLRQFVGFEKLISADKLHTIKHLTNALEAKFLKNEKRRINIDPGYLTLGKVILATTKDYSHRVYLKDGIFAEVTLYFKNATYKPWPWTYPDYQSRQYIDFFMKLRSLYQKDIKDAR